MLEGFRIEAWVVTAQRLDRDLQRGARPIVPDPANRERASDDLELALAICEGWWVRCIFADFLHPPHLFLEAHVEQSCLRQASREHRSTCLQLAQNSKEHLSQDQS